MSREHFVAAGKLFPCPNPPHNFSIGRLLGCWQWASDSWGHINQDGNLVTAWIGVGKTETPDSLVAYHVVLWKLSVILGVVR